MSPREKKAQQQHQSHQLTHTKYHPIPHMLSPPPPKNHPHQLTEDPHQSHISSTSLQSPNATSTPFQFPKFYSLAPFFTRQPVMRTYMKQLHLWEQLLLSYAAHYRIYSLHVKHGVFFNENIHRGLEMGFVRDIFLDLVKQNKAEWVNLETASVMYNDDGERVADEIRIYWKNKEEWANEIWNWVLETGREGAVCTIYELREGETSEGSSFHGMDLHMMRDVLDVLEKRGKAVRMGEEGVKFARH